MGIGRTIHFAGTAAVIPKAPNPGYPVPFPDALSVHGSIQANNTLVGQVRFNFKNENDAKDWYSFVSKLLVWGAKILREGRRQEWQPIFHRQGFLRKGEADAKRTTRYCSAAAH